MNSNALGSGRGSTRNEGDNPEGGKKSGEGDGADNDDDEDGGDGPGKACKAADKSRKAAPGSKGQHDTLFNVPTRRQRRQQYVRFSLVDLSSTSASSSATGQLSLMLVQADSEDKTIDEDGNEISVYKGQSGGAYEKFWKESAGAVVAIINPNFLPYHKVCGHFRLCFSARGYSCAQVDLMRPHLAGLFLHTQADVGVLDGRDRPGRKPRVLRSNQS